MALERVRGCILGGAVGDAFGYAVEFDRWPVIERRFGSAGITEPVAKNGRIIVSDDTQMTLFTMEALADSRDAVARRDHDAVVERIRRAYLDWRHTQEARATDCKPVGEIAHDPSLRNRRAPGLTCLAALRSGGRGTIARPINDSKGCGGVMRVAPIGFLSGLEPGQAAARRGASNHRTAIEALGEGWVGEEALAIGLYSAMVARSFSEAIAIAANHDGDSDSTASIAAQLYGGRRGLADLRHRWITRLDVKDVRLGQIKRTYFPPA